RGAARREAGRGRVAVARLSARRAPRRARLLRALDRELVVRGASQSGEPPVPGDPRAAWAELRRLLLHRGVSGRRRLPDAPDERAAAPPALRDLAADAAERAGAVRAAGGAPRARAARRDGNVARGLRADAVVLEEIRRALRRDDRGTARLRG